MTQPPGKKPPARDRWRKELREGRRREFFDAARAIVNTDGPQALTMQRVTKEVGTSEGSIYHYFASKDVLLGELEIHALDVLSQAFRQGQENLRSHLDAVSASARLAALTQAVGSARFFIAAEVTLPNEVELSRRIYSQPDTLHTEQVQRVVDAGLSFLQMGAATLDNAVDRRVLKAANNIERSLLVFASVAGPLLASRLDTWDAGIFDGRRMARELIQHLFTGWGAPSKLLTQADAVLDALRDEQLAPT